MISHVSSGLVVLPHSVSSANLELIATVFEARSLKQKFENQSSIQSWETFPGKLLQLDSALLFSGSPHQSSFHQKTY